MTYRPRSGPPIRRQKSADLHRRQHRQFGNRREVAAHAGLAPTPWRSGTIEREQPFPKQAIRPPIHTQKAGPGTEC